MGVSGPGRGSTWAGGWAGTGCKSQANTGPPQGGQGYARLVTWREIGKISNHVKNNEKQISYVKRVFQTRRGMRPECTSGTG